MCFWNIIVSFRWSVGASSVRLMRPYVIPVILCGRTREQEAQIPGRWHLSCRRPVRAGTPAAFQGKENLGPPSGYLAVARLVTVSGLFPVDRVENVCLQDFLHQELMSLILTQFETTGLLPDRRTSVCARLRSSDL